MEAHLAKLVIIEQVSQIISSPVFARVSYALDSLKTEPTVCNVCSDVCRLKTNEH